MYDYVKELFQLIKCERFSDFVIKTHYGIRDGSFKLDKVEELIKELCHDAMELKRYDNSYWGTFMPDEVDSMCIDYLLIELQKLLYDNVATLEEPFIVFNNSKMNRTSILSYVYLTRDELVADYAHSVESSKSLFEPQDLDDYEDDLEDFVSMLESQLINDYLDERFFPTYALLDHFTDDRALAIFALLNRGVSIQRYKIIESAYGFDFSNHTLKEIEEWMKYSCDCRCFIEKCNCNEQSGYERSHQKHKNAKNFEELTTAVTEELFWLQFDHRFPLTTYLVLTDQSPC